MKKTFIPISKEKIKRAVAQTLFENPNMQEIGIKLAHIKNWPPTNEDLIKYVAQGKGYVQVRNGVRVMMVPKNADKT